MVEDSEGGIAEFKCANRNGTAAILKSALGEIPFAGSLCGEILSIVIPNQRVSRIESYLGYLTDRLADIDPDTLRTRLQNPQIFDLVKEGAVRSFTAKTNLRKQFIAESVASGITGGSEEAKEAKRLLGTLAEIDDDHVKVLLGSLRQSRERPAVVNVAETIPPPDCNHYEQNNSGKDTAWQLPAAVLVQPVKV
jgi:hypothetical protein